MFTQKFLWPGMVLLFNSVSEAQSAAPAAGGTPSTVEAFLLPLAFMMGIFYLLVWRPQQKRATQQQQFLSSLQKGDEIITASGIYGEITGLTDKVATIQIADNVKIKILRSQVLKKAADEQNAAGANQKSLAPKGNSGKGATL